MYTVPGHGWAKEVLNVRETVLVPGIEELPTDIDGHVCMDVVTDIAAFQMRPLLYPKYLLLSSQMRVGNFVQFRLREFLP